MVEARTRYVIMIKTMLGRKIPCNLGCSQKQPGFLRTVKYDLKELRASKEYGVDQSKRSYGYRLLVGDGSDMDGLSRRSGKSAEK